MATLKAAAPLNKEQFVVDASLLQELGERLIGRPAIALGELVKNAYDADASVCRIEFQPDRIVVSDNGHGMSKDAFLNFWMRIGTTHKVDERISPGHRSFTGSKGIGRLSTQFLAHEMELESTQKTDPDEYLYAVVNWKAAVRGEDLSTVAVLWEMRPKDASNRYPGGARSGTRITLSQLRGPWDEATIKALGDDVWMLRSPFTIAGGVGGSTPEDFTIEIEAPGIANAREEFDRTFRRVFSNWKARILGKLERGRSGGEATVSVEFVAGYPEGSERKAVFREPVRLPIDNEALTARPLVDGATFEILVFKPEGKQPGAIPVGELRGYLHKYGNVAVYDGGFRLPYYGSGTDPAGHDWLLIAADQGRRLTTSKLLPEHLRTQTKYMQDLPAPGRIFGVVNVDTNQERAVAEKTRRADEPCLQIQPGRDRLRDNDAYGQLRDLVRFSLDLYANRFRLLALQASEKRRDKEPASRKYDRVQEILNEHEPSLPKRAFRELTKEVSAARKASQAEEETIDRRSVMLAPLATAGMVALALNHELSRESAQLERIGDRLRQLASKCSIPELKTAADEFDSARGRLDSLRELFAPLLSEADQTANDRLRVSEVVRQTEAAMKALMPGVRFDKRGIPAALRFPLGSLAEWSALLQNVLANAWNAMLDSRKAVVSFDGGRDRQGREWLRISDTGQGLALPLSGAEKLFEPFERRMKISNDKRSIAIGGHGLGLAIVRMIAHKRSTKVAFVTPEDGFSTTLEISWRGAKP